MKHSEVVKVLEKTAYELLDGNNELIKIDENCYEINMENTFSLTCEIGADKVKEKSTSNIHVSVLVGEIDDLNACIYLMANRNLRKGYSNYFFTIQKYDDTIALFLETDVFIWPEFSIELASVALFYSAIAPLLVFSFERKNRKDWPQGISFYEISWENLLLRTAKTMAGSL